MPFVELLTNVITSDAPNVSATFSLRKKCKLYLAFAQMTIQQTRVFDTIAQVTKTSDFFHAVSMSDCLPFVNKKSLFRFAFHHFSKQVTSDCDFELASVFDAGVVNIVISFHYERCLFEWR